MKVKGVNLGNWLVLEKWMSPALFDGTTAASIMAVSKFFDGVSDLVMGRIVDKTKSRRWVWEMRRPRSA